MKKRKDARPVRRRVTSEASFEILGQPRLEAVREFDATQGCENADG